MVMSTLHSRNDFETSAFMDEEIVFSSFCHRIEAARLFGRVLTITGKHGVWREQALRLFQSAHNALGPAQQENSGVDTTIVPGQATDGGEIGVDDPI